MPPFLPRKRSSPPASPGPAVVKKARLADALDADATRGHPSLKRKKTFSVQSNDSSSDSTLSDVDSDQFEEVPIQPERYETTKETDEEDGDIIWEDAEVSAQDATTSSPKHLANGPIQISIRADDDDVVDYGTATQARSGKKGPSKREKRTRILTHQLHVQFLLWHNAVRNSWIGDKTLHDILLGQLPPQIVKEVEKWRKASGLGASSSLEAAPQKSRKRRKKKERNERDQRDWGQPSQRLEEGKADMSHGDPLISLMKVLSAYWKKRFAITAPGLRKRGYGTKHGLRQEITSLRKDKHDATKHGEKIESLTELRDLAQKGEGSRDVGAQLFTALLRALGIEARLVASLQPSGYGWTKAEQMLPKRAAKVQDDDNSSNDNLRNSKHKLSSNRRSQLSKSGSAKRQSNVINIDTDDDQEGDLDHNDIGDDESLVDVTPSMPKQRKPKYDRDLFFPIYWTEAVSPITNKVLPVSPLVLETPVALTPEVLSLFEPRGSKAEKGRQVIAYVIAYSQDGTAKDVTVRYLRKHIWPGKTKGVRIPVEKLPVYDRRGRIKRHENYDWFEHIFSPYRRPKEKLTTIDEIEDATDLVPLQPEKAAEDESVDTLQSLKTSADFALERFLRREEALRPGAEAVRTFASGKGEKSKEEAVFRRADVVRCLSAESWHKEGRRPKLGEMPMKMVPVRAVTLTRKREAEDYERQYGEKQTQGLYSWDQTEWIIPAPIEHGVIPKNAYGNMDCFVPSMVPKGAVHIPLRGTVRVCKKLDIDFAEAVTGFEFGNKRAVPVCTGVVVAEENERLVKDAWHEWNEEQRRKEDAKMEKTVLDLWRKFVLGLRIRERVQDMYGDEIDAFQDVATGFTKDDAISIDDGEDVSIKAGDSGNEDHEEEGGGFLLPHEDEPASMEDLVMDDHLRPSQRSNEQYWKESEMSTRSKESPESTTPQRNSVSHRDDRPLTSTPDHADDDSDDDSNMGVGKASVLSEAESHRQSKGQSARKVGRLSRYGEDKSVTNDDHSDDIGNISSIEEHDDESEETEEEYIPRSTRTRATKAVPVVRDEVEYRDQRKRTGPLKATSKANPKAQSHVGHNGDDTDGSKPPTKTPRSERATTRGHQRTKEGTRKSKRSTRSSKNKTTGVTSPYFDP